MYALSVMYDIDPARREDFIRFALAHAERCLAREEGCLEFRVFQSPDNPDSFYFHEVYADRAALEEVHATTEYLAEFRSTITPWTRHREVHTWKSVGR